MQFPIFANALFRVSGDNLAQKRQSNPCKQVAIAAGVQGEAKAL